MVRMAGHETGENRSEYFPQIHGSQIHARWCYLRIGFEHQSQWRSGKEWTGWIFFSAKILCVSEYLKLLLLLLLLQLQLRLFPKTFFSSASSIGNLCPPERSCCAGQCAIACLPGCTLERVLLTRQRSESLHPNLVCQPPRNFGKATLLFSTTPRNCPLSTKSGMCVKNTSTSKSNPRQAGLLSQAGFFFLSPFVVSVCFKFNLCL